MALGRYRSYHNYKVVVYLLIDRIITLVLSSEFQLILAENVYNMDETEIMLSMLNSVKVLASKDETRGYRGARVKRAMVTAIECISADGRYLKPMMIWPALTY